ncbi:MAG: RlmE family RNA methyltransferase [Parvibaculales bacterium]
MPEKKNTRKGRIKARLQTARGRKTSSARWLQRQINDPYVAAAKEEGYRSRAAFKLKEIEERYHLLEKGSHVLDLGAAPGGWSQIAKDYIGEGGKVLAIDIADMEPIAGVEFLQLDLYEEDTLQKIKDHAGGLFHAVLSDIAAPVTGHRQTDHLRTQALAELAAEYAFSLLRPKGNFCTKVFQGGTQKELLERLKSGFEKVIHFKPKASRKESVEMYVLALSRLS